MSITTRLIKECSEHGDFEKWKKWEKSKKIWKFIFKFGKSSSFFINSLIWLQFTNQLPYQFLVFVNTKKVMTFTDMFFKIWVCYYARYEKRKVSKYQLNVINQAFDFKNSFSGA